MRDIELIVCALDEYLVHYYDIDDFRSWLRYTYGIQYTPGRPDGTLYTVVDPAKHTLFLMKWM